jgi:selenium metabolism protein YedF
MADNVDIDARGLSCPLPVIKTKQALDAMESGMVTVLIERPEGRQNVERFAKSQGHTVETTEKDGLYSIRVTKLSCAECAVFPETGTVFMVTGDTLGSGDEELGKILMRSLIATVVQSDSRPAKMLFINRGVFLTTEGSPVLDDLTTLENGGVEIFSCGTCLDFYGLKEKLKVGQVTNMFDTVSSLLSGNGVVRI